jgi:hypothetical protein
MSLKNIELNIEKNDVEDVDVIEENNEKKSEEDTVVGFEMTKKQLDKTSKKSREDIEVSEIIKKQAEQAKEYFRRKRKDKGLPQIEELQSEQIKEESPKNKKFEAEVSDILHPELESKEIIVEMKNKDLEPIEELVFSDPQIESQTNIIEAKENLAKNLELSAKQEFERCIKEKKRDSKESFIAKQDQNLSKKLWQENFDKLYSNLSKSEQKEIEDLIKNGSKVLEGEDVKNLFISGLSLSDIKDIKYSHWWSRKIKSKLSKKEVKDDDFDKLVKEKIEESKKQISIKTKKILGDVWEKSRQVFINSFVDNKLNNLEEKQFAELEKKQNYSEPMSIKNKLYLLNDIRNYWKNAKRIDRALKTGKKIKVQEGDVLDPKTQQKELEEMKGFLSEEIIKSAEELSGRKLKLEAIKITGYKLDKNPEKQKEYRRWLTNEIPKIFKAIKEEVEKTTGKKIKTKKKS